MMTTLILVAFLNGKAVFEFHDYKLEADCWAVAQFVNTSGKPVQATCFSGKRA
jgi:hypothetical protein